MQAFLFIYSEVCWATLAAQWSRAPWAPGKKKAPAVDRAEAFCCRSCFAGVCVPAMSPSHLRSSQDVDFLIKKWSPRQESNLYLSLRRRPFYPLNYGEGRWILPVLWVHHRLGRRRFQQPVRTANSLSYKGCPLAHLSILIAVTAFM